MLSREQRDEVINAIKNDEAFLSLTINNKPELVPVVFRPVLFGLFNQLGKRKLRHLVTLVGMKKDAISYTEDGLPVFSTCLCVFDGDWELICHSLKKDRKETRQQSS